MSDDFRSRAVSWSKGNHFEDFQVGQIFEHHWGRTVDTSDNNLFNTLTLHFNPTYFNREYARANGHKDTLINPLLVFNMVLGLSVEDLSEAGGPFVGVEKLAYKNSIFAGDTITARSTTLSARLSDSKPGFGIVSWATEGFNQHGDAVIAFERANLVMTKALAGQIQSAREKTAGAKS
ncbi:MAG: MaoC family dehydratase [Sphingorhabdus sp.]